MSNMVKLSKWEDINKALFRRHLPHTISARELFVFRQFDLIFSNKLENIDAHQCFCGQLFLAPKSRLQDIKKDFLGNPICPKCAQSPEDYEDREWRQKFELFRKLTEAIQALERSPPEQRVITEQRVRGLSQGLFEYKDLKELYLKYFKLMDELGAQEDYVSRLKPEIRALIEELFRQGKERNFVEFIKFIFSPDPSQTQQIKDTIWESNLAVIRAEKDYFLEKVSDYPVLIKPIEKEDLARSQLVAQLLLYCHLIEMDSLYDLSLNLAEIAKGRHFKKKPFPSSIKYPWEKIERIKKANKSLGAILREIYCREIRNAFAHSKYKIEGGYFIKTDENLRISIEHVMEKVNLLNAYWSFLYYKIGQEQIIAMEKGEMKTKNGDVIKIGVGWKENQN
jgi:hypothetical protein